MVIKMIRLNLLAAEKAGARCSVTTWWMCAADSAAAGFAPLDRDEDYDDLVQDSDDDHHDKYDGITWWMCAADASAAAGFAPLDMIFIQWMVMDGYGDYGWLW